MQIGFANSRKKPSTPEENARLNDLLAGLF
jgi:hypothetical protein